MRSRRAYLRVLSSTLLLTIASIVMSAAAALGGDIQPPVPR